MPFTAFLSFQTGKKTIQVTQLISLHDNASEHMPKDTLVSLGQILFT